MPGIDWFWENLEQVVVNNDFQNCRFNPTAQLLHLANHLVQQHGGAQMSLLKYYDLHLLVEKLGAQIDWQELALQAQAQRRSSVFHTALIGCVRRFGTNIDPHYLATLQSEIVDDLISAEVTLPGR